MNLNTASEQAQRAARGDNRWICVLCMTLLFPCALSAADHAGEPRSYSAPAHEGRVIDSHSQQPISGVIVAISWRFSSASSFDAPPFVVMETVTNKDGHFSFPGWGPKDIPAGAVVSPAAPELILFRPDYDFLYLKNKPATRGNGNSVLTSEWQGKIFAMPHPKDDMVVKIGSRVMSRSSIRLRGMVSILSWAYMGQGCEWKSMPRMMQAIYRRAHELNSQGIPDAYAMVSTLIPPPGAPDPCGARLFFGKE